VPNLTSLTGRAYTLWSDNLPLFGPIVGQLLAFIWSVYYIGTVGVISANCSMCFLDPREHRFEHVALTVVVTEHVLVQVGL
jgi:hypothetical protein